MKVSIKFIFLACLFFALLPSCTDEQSGMDIIDLEYKNITLKGQGELYIPVLSPDDWAIESIIDEATGAFLYDKEGGIVALYQQGKVENGEGWLSLQKYNDKGFHLILGENFDRTQNRRLKLTLSTTGSKNIISIVQKASKGFQLIDSVLKELEDQREIYSSSIECKSIVLENRSSMARWGSYNEVFENVRTVAVLSSDEYGAFRWMDQDHKLTIPALMIDSISYYVDQTEYREGIVESFRLKGVDPKILLNPNVSLRLNGEVVYCKRKFEYTLTLQNVETRQTFEVKGFLKHILPITYSTFVLD